MASMATKRTSAKRGTKEAKSDLAVSYDEFKEHEGQRYTGMKIGRSHKWHYDRGEWKEKKITPDLWQIGYAVTKRRAGPPTTTRRPSPVSSSKSRTGAQAVKSGALRRGPNANA
jgi:hypothetical protein